VATIQISVPDQYVPLVLDALYAQRIPEPEETTPPTKLAWAKLWIRKQIINAVAMYRESQQYQAIRAELQEINEVLSVEPTG